MNDCPFVATLICDPANPVLNASMLARAQGVLERALGRIEEPSLWLAPEIAADIPFTVAYDQDKLDARALSASVQSVLESAPVDVIIQPRANRKKRLFIADMDSTIIGQECIDELADCAGLKERVALITEQAMRGEIEFEPALRARVALLKNLPETMIRRVLEDRIRLTAGARTLVRTMRANGAYTALVSGGFTAFAAPVAEMTGFHEIRANSLLVDHGGLTGSVREPILGRQAKRDALLMLRKKHHLAPIDTLAVGDGANDLSMLQEAGLGVAFHAKPAVAAAAAAAVTYGDLTALLYAQGYAQQEFVN